MSYRITFLDPNSNNTFSLPVNPPKVEIQYSGNHKKFDMLALGEVVQSRIQTLDRIRWSSFFPRQLNMPYVVNSINPVIANNFFISWLDNPQPLMLIIERQLPEMALPEFYSNWVLLESFNIEERGGETGDIYYSLTLSSYRFFEPQSVDITLVETTIGEMVQDGKMVNEPGRPVNNDLYKIGDVVWVLAGYTNPTEARGRFSYPKKTAWGTIAYIYSEPPYGSVKYRLNAEREPEDLGEVWTFTEKSKIQKGIIFTAYCAESELAPKTIKVLGWDTNTTNFWDWDNTFDKWEWVGGGTGSVVT